MKKLYFIQQGYTYYTYAHALPITTWDLLNVDGSFDQWTFDDEGRSIFKEAKSFKSKKAAEKYLEAHFKPFGSFTYRITD